MGVGGFTFGRLTHERKQSVLRLLPKLSRFYGGRAVDVIFEEPPAHVRASEGR
jgi:hypothetical protein